MKKCLRINKENYMLYKYDVLCPKCKEKLHLEIDAENMDFDNGIAKVAIFHGDPPHSLILYINEEGSITGTELAEFTIMFTKPEQVTEELKSKISEHVGLRTLVPLYAAFIIDEPFYILASVEKKIIADFARELFSEFPAKFDVVENEISESFKIIVIDKAFYEHNVDKLRSKVVYDMITGNFTMKIPPLKYLYDFAKKREKIGFKGLAEIYAKILELKFFFKKILDIVEFMGQLSVKRLKQEFKLSKKEIELIADLLELKGYNSKSILKWDTKVLF